MRDVRYGGLQEWLQLVCNFGKVVLNELVGGVPDREGLRQKDAQKIIHSGFAFPLEW